MAKRNSIRIAVKAKLVGSALSCSTNIYNLSLRVVTASQPCVGRCRWLSLCVPSPTHNWPSSTYSTSIPTTPTMTSPTTPSLPWVSSALELTTQGILHINKLVCKFSGHNKDNIFIYLLFALKVGYDAASASPVPRQVAGALVHGATGAGTVPRRQGNRHTLPHPRRPTPHQPASSRRPSRCTYRLPGL